MDSMAHLTYQGEHCRMTYSFNGHQIYPFKVLVRKQVNIDVWCIFIDSFMDFLVDEMLFVIFIIIDLLVEKLLNLFIALCDLTLKELIQLVFVSQGKEQVLATIALQQKGCATATDVVRGVFVNND